ALLMPTREANGPQRRSVGSEFVRNDYGRGEAMLLKQFPHEFQRGSLVAPSLSTARHIYIRRPPTETTISSRCHRSWGLARTLRRFLAIAGPNFKTHRRIDSLLTSSPLSA